uniref:Uncharacterized protein n=1 Tax=Glossina austeni TaxID=7395 RepID=A0A1A9VY90_GLOAU
MDTFNRYESLLYLPEAIATFQGNFAMPVSKCALRHTRMQVTITIKIYDRFKITEYDNAFLSLDKYEQFLRPIDFATKTFLIDVEFEDKSVTHRVICLSAPLKTFAASKMGLENLNVAIHIPNISKQKDKLPLHLLWCIVVYHEKSMHTYRLMPCGSERNYCYRISD